MPTSARSEAIWDPVETGARERLRGLQLERLRSTVTRTLDHQPPFASRLAEAGVADAREISSLDELARLPFSRKPRVARTASPPSSGTPAPTSMPGPR
jgi:phenylacetate-coenzyme A ligase PaaK-like adenylate-forming protein